MLFDVALLSQGSEALVGARRQHVVELQVIILKIGRIDTKNETFFAEFFLEATWTQSLNELPSARFVYDAKKCFNPRIYIKNVIGKSLWVTGC